MIESDALVMKFQELGLFTLAETLQRMFFDPKFQDIHPFELLGMALDEELDQRSGKQTDRLLKRAKLKHTHACIGEIEYRPERQLDRTLVERLSLCDFARTYRNICVFGASGTGKSFLGKSLGVAACHAGFRTLYVRFSALMRELARLEKNDSKKYESRLNYYGRIPVLIIDEWLADAKKPGYAAILLELMEIRYSVTSTIFCSQLDPEGWSLALDVKALGQSIMGRAVSNSFVLHVSGEDMRKYYSKKP